jgi:hypothetical protein
MVYPSALPQDTDVLNTNKYALLDSSFQNAAIIGQSGSFVAGLACTPTGPASLQVNVGVGSIFQVDPTDANAYGSLGIDNTTIMKMGILQAPVTLTITPPATSGFSQVYLVEAIIQDQDSGSFTLSYFNSSNENQPFSGPNNSGSPNFTQRLCNCVIALKAGVAATTGTQTTPAPDVGYVGLFAITVANGQTQITSPNIVQLATAPFFPTLPQVPYQVQGGTYIYAGQDTGAANAYVVTFQPGQPIPASYTSGLTVKFKALNACSGASTVNVNGLGNVAIRRATGVALTTGDIVSGQVVELTYDGAFFQMANYLGSGATSNTNTLVGIPYVADSGTQNAIVAAFSPAITAGQQIAGLVISVKLANTITGACTINVNGLGAKAVTLGDATNPPYNVFVANMDLLLEYDGTEYQIVNTSAGMFYRRPTANYNIYVNTATGSDSLYDGTSASVGTGTSGPFKTIGRAISAAWSYAPSQFTITIQVAAGTYNESVSTPQSAGPSVIINGASAASVTVIASGSLSCFVSQGPNFLTAQNVTVQCNPAGVAAFLATTGSSMLTSNTASNACGYVFAASQGASLAPGNHTFNSSCSSLYFAQAGASINLANATHTFSGAIAVTASALVLNGTITVLTTGSNTPITFVNPNFVSGPKYLATLNGVINSESQGVNYFPGSAPGTTQTGGQYS